MAALWRAVSASCSASQGGGGGDKDEPGAGADIEAGGAVEGETDGDTGVRVGSAGRMRNMREAQVAYVTMEGPNAAISPSVQHPLAAHATSASGRSDRPAVAPIWCVAMPRLGSSLKKKVPRTWRTTGGADAVAGSISVSTTVW